MENANENGSPPKYWFLILILIVVLVAIVGSAFS